MTQCMCEVNFKRLLALNQLGCWLRGEDGHIWIEYERDEDSCLLARILSEGGISINNKIYGGVLEALNVVDAALQRAGHHKLIDTYCSEVSFLGEDTLDESRIIEVEKGNPGIG